MESGGCEPGIYGGSVDFKEEWKMSASMVLLFTEMRQTQEGPMVIVQNFAAIGLTANGANTVPFPFKLNTVPRRVTITPTGNGAAGALASLDTSQGAADSTGSFAGGKLGYDQQNLYVYIGNATQFAVTVECSQA
jgi:hypothetical protein